MCVSPTLTAAICYSAIHVVLLLTTSVDPFYVFMMLREMVSLIQSSWTGKSKKRNLVIYELFLFDIYFMFAENMVNAIGGLLVLGISLHAVASLILYNTRKQDPLTILLTTCAFIFVAISRMCLIHHFPN